MNRTSFNRARLGAVLSLGLVLCVIGCADPSAAQAPPGARRSNVAQPFVTLTPSAVEVAPGASVVLTAKPQGGEAMLFAVDWRIKEGPAGGLIASDGKRSAEGTYLATYTAPASGAGPFHVEASIREYPAATAVTAVTIVRRP